MIELYVIRHGLAGKPLADALLDEERPLTKKGKGRMKDIARSIEGLDISFDSVISSPLARAKESADIISEYCGGSIATTDLLKPGSSYDDLIGYLNGLEGQEKVAIVGHEPFLSGFASYCLSKSKSSYIKLRKGGILLLEVEGALKPGKCKLAWLMEPSQITGLS